MDALFEVGWHKSDIDFHVRGDICALTQEEMNEFRAMIVVAIGTMEEMWRRHQQNQASLVPSRMGAARTIDKSQLRWCPACERMHLPGEHDLK